MLMKLVQAVAAIFLLILLFKITIAAVKILLFLAVAGVIYNIIRQL